GRHGYDARWYIPDPGRGDRTSGEVAAIYAIVRRSIEVYRSHWYGSPAAAIRVWWRHLRSGRETGEFSIYEFDKMNTAIAFLATILTFNANQGTAVQVTFPDEPGLKSVEIVWDMKKVPLFLVDNTWRTILGVDLDTKPGEHKTEVLFTMKDGSVDRRQTVIQV